jgi:hypothetical protein
MTALAKIEPRQMVPNYAMADLERMAIAFARSGLFGAKTPDQALALCLIAQAEGKHPAIASKSYHIINGSPAKKADAMLGDFQAMGGKVDWHEYTDASVSATFSHPEGGSVRVDWDDARVAKAGLSGNPNHKKYPRAMKRARCISEGVRTVYPGATSGMYAPEEIQDGGVLVAERNDPPRLTGAALLAQASPADAAPEASAADIPSTDAGQSAGAASNDAPSSRKTALKLTDEYVAKVEAMQSPTEIAEFEATAAAWLDKLAASKPDLREHIRLATLAKIDALAADDAQFEPGWDTGNPMTAG